MLHKNQHPAAKCANAVKQTPPCPRPPFCYPDRRPTAPLLSSRPEAHTLPFVISTGGPPCGPQWRDLAANQPCRHAHPVLLHRTRRNRTPGSTSRGRGADIASLPRFAQSYLLVKGPRMLIRSVRVRPARVIRHRVYTVPSLPKAIELTYAGRCPSSRKIAPWSVYLPAATS
jgi:hypothetical protein